MTFESPRWYPAAILLSIGNVAGAGFAIMEGQLWHSTFHIGLAIAFGVWAKHLGEQLRRRPDQTRRDARVELLEGEVSELQRELNQTRDGLDFAEQLLRQRQEAPLVQPEREIPEQPAVDRQPPSQ